jgi:hypothetical protein
MAMRILNRFIWLAPPAALPEAPDTAVEIIP